MRAAWLWAKVAQRGRWRATILLILIVGLAGGVVLTTIAGARRSSTAYSRFREATLASDLDIAFEEEPLGDVDRAFELVAAFPEVAAASRVAFPFLVPANSGFYPYIDFLALVPLDEAFSESIDRPRVVEGRLPDTNDAEEAVIIELFAQEAGVGVGDRVEFESFAPEQMEPLFTTGDAGPPAGPEFTLEITGIVDAPTFLSESSGDFLPRVILSPAFVGAHGDEVATYPGGFSVRLHNGAADVPAVSAKVQEVLGQSTTLELTPASEVDRKLDPSIDVIVTALLLCALVAGLAGTVIVAQALARHLAVDVTADRTVAALGMTPRERLLAKVLASVPVAAGGAVAAVVAALGASPLMPVGVARSAEPDRGLSADPLVLSAGAAAIAALVLALAGAIAAAGRARALTTAAGTGEPRSTPVLQVARRSLSPAASVGVGFALGDRGASGATRSALLSMAGGATGLVGVVVFVASITTLVDSPARFGSPFDAVIFGFSGDVLAEGGDEFLADPAIQKAGLLATGRARIGIDEINSHSFESLKGGLVPTILSGRLPQGRGEVVLGAQTLERAAEELGDTVTIAGAGGEVNVTIVGTAVFPVVDERSIAGRGVLLVPDDLERISSPDELNADVVLAWAEGVDRNAAMADLAERTGTEVSPPRLPSDVKNLSDVESLPRAIGALLAVLAALAAVHALASTVRGRRRDLAVLKTLGFDHRQLRSIIRWQATTLVVIGVMLGVPSGIIVGRVVWRSLAQDIGVVDAPVVPLLAVAGIVVAALAGVNGAAVVPSRRASRVQPATEFRSTA